MLNIGRKNCALHLSACCTWKHTNIKTWKYFRWKSAFHAIFFLRRAFEVRKRSHLGWGHGWFSFYNWSFFEEPSKLENARIWEGWGHGWFSFYNWWMKKHRWWFILSISDCNCWSKRGRWRIPFNSISDQDRISP